jgi:hypothetical protein
VSTLCQDKMPIYFPCVVPSQPSQLPGSTSWVLCVEMFNKIDTRHAGQAGYELASLHTPSAPQPGTMRRVYCLEPPSSMREGPTGPPSCTNIMVAVVINMLDGLVDAGAMQHLIRRVILVSISAYLHLLAHRYLQWVLYAHRADCRYRCSAVDLCRS